MSRSAEGAVGSIRRLGRPRPSQPALSPRRAPPRQPPPALSPGRPGRATAPSSRRPSHRARVGLSPAPVQSASGRKRPPSLRPHPHRRGGRETCPPPFPAPAAPLPPTPGGRIPLPPTRCPKGVPRAPNLTASGIPAALPSRPSPPFRPAPAGETALPAARPPSGAAGSHVPAGATSGRRETLPAAVLPGRPFCPRPAARPRSLPASNRPFRRQRDAFILWRPNEMRLSRRPTEGRPVGSKRRLGRPAALPANPPAPARSSPPATTHPSSRPPRENRRSLLPPPFPPRAGWAFPHPHPERLRPEETALPLPAISPARRTGNLPATLSGPDRTLRRLPTAESRSLRPAARKVFLCAHNLTASGIPAPIPSRPGPPFRPAPVERLPSLRPARLSARRAPTSWPRRPVAGGKPFRRPFCPTALSARALRLARAPFRPQAGPFRRQRDAFIFWRPNDLRMSRSAEGAVGSIRRLGRPRPSQPTRSPRRAPPGQPPPARPAGRPGRATAPSSRRPCRRAQVGLSRAPAQSASGRRDRPPCARYLTSAAAGNLARHPLRPRPHSPLAPGGRIPLPPAHCPEGAPARSPPDRLRDFGRHPFPAGPSLPARSGRRRPPSLWPARSSARPAPASRPGRPAAGGKPSRRPFCPVALSARALRPACAPFRPQAGPSAARGMPLSSGGPTDRG